MKKIFSLIAFLAFTIAAHAQLSFVCDGKEIASGATFTTSKCDQEVFEEDGEYAFTPDVKVKSTEAANVTVVASSSKSFQFCFGGSCQVGTNFEKTGNLEANKATSLQIEPAGYYLPEDSVTFTINIAAYITGKESSTRTTMTLVVSNNPDVLAIHGTTASAPAISFAHASLNYAFASAAQRTLTLTSLSGATIATYPLSSARGSISVANLRPGVYVYSISGEQMKGKIAVK